MHGLMELHCFVTGGLPSCSSGCFVVTGAESESVTREHQKSRSSMLEVPFSFSNAFLSLLCRVFIACVQAWAERPG